MGQKLGDDNIPKLVVASTTTATLAITNGGQPTLCTIAGQQFSPASLLTLNTATVGANGLDAGALGVSQLWYVYAIANQSTFAMALVASLSATPTMPSGYGTAYKLVGGFNTNVSSQVSFTVTPSDGVVIPIGAPNVQTFLSGSGTYTTPANAVWIHIRMVGGGGGGGQNGTGTSTATAGTSTTFGANTANGGGGGGTAPTGAKRGGLGGGGTIGVGTGVVFKGGDGMASQWFSSASISTDCGGTGGSGMFGGGGSGGAFSLLTGLDGSPNTGGGGGGMGVDGNANYATGSGGGAGGGQEVYITTPGASYAYAVGGGGAGSAGNGAGGSGVIIVIAYFA